MGFIADAANAFSRGVDRAQAWANDVGQSGQQAIDNAQAGANAGAQWADGQVEQAGQTVGAWVQQGVEAAEATRQALLDTSIEDIVNGINEFGVQVHQRAQAIGRFIGGRVGEAGDALQQTLRDGWAQLEAGMDTARAFLQDHAEQVQVFGMQAIEMVRNGALDFGTLLVARFNEVRNDAITYLTSARDNTLEMLRETQQQIEQSIERGKERARERLDEARRDAQAAAEYVYTTSLGEMVNDLNRLLAGA